MAHSLTHVRLQNANCQAELATQPTDSINILYIIQFYIIITIQHAYQQQQNISHLHSNQLRLTKNTSYLYMAISLAVCFTQCIVR